MEGLWACKSCIAEERECYVISGAKGRMEVWAEIQRVFALDHPGIYNPKQRPSKVFCLNCTSAGGGTCSYWALQNLCPTTMTYNQRGFDGGRLQMRSDHPVPRALHRPKPMSKRVFQDLVDTLTDNERMPKPFWKWKGKKDAAAKVILGPSSPSTSNAVLVNMIRALSDTMASNHLAITKRLDAIETSIDILREEQMEEGSEEE
jgi:hypothetical protein